jgi:hypothetical protein
MKHSDNNNNNNSKFATLFVSEINIDEKTICKTIDVESSKTSMEAKDKSKFIYTSMYLSLHGIDYFYSPYFQTRR